MKTKATTIGVLVAVLACMGSGKKHRFQISNNLGQSEDVGQSGVGQDNIQYFTQRNDHFNKGDSGNWSQRYAVDKTYWGGNGYPIFVMLGGEGPMGESVLSGKRYVISEWGEEARALLVNTEHRFYGKSIPGDGTLSRENLRLLSADQALADFAVLIESIKEEYGAPDSKVVTFGGSYSGSLSAWMRQKYPNVVDAALASSAPILAQLDFPEYQEVVTDSLGETCAARVKEAFAEITALLESDEGRGVLAEDFVACEAISNEEKDQVTFLESLVDSVAGVVQYSGDANSLGRAYNITRMCGLIEEPGTAPYAAFATFVQDYMLTMGGACTEASYAAFVESLSSTDPAAPGAAGRSWYYQTCGEYGYYQTTTSSRIPYPPRITLDYFLDMCNDVYGNERPSEADSVVQTNRLYGALSPATTAVVYSNGEIDPWHALGLTTSPAASIPVHYIEGTAHCADLYASTPEDLPSLTNARTAIWETLQKWIA